VVDSATVRMLPTITPSISSSTNTHSVGLVGSVAAARSDPRWTARAAAYRTSETRLDASMTVRLRWWSTRLPNQMPDTAVSTR
jgi:hypothetical protein